MDIEKMLHEEIVEDFNELKETEFGTDEYRSGAESVAKLMDRAIELKKIESDAELTKAEQKSENRNRIIGHIVTGVTTAAGILLTIWGTKATFKFEETGTITTTMGRGFLNKLMFKK